MTDVEGKTPTKRKSFSNAQDKKGSAKKAKINNAKTPQQGVSAKLQNKNKQNNSQKSPQNSNKKNKKNSQSENDSPKKLKPFPGTQVASVEKIVKKNKEVQKKDGTEDGEKKKKRRNQFHNLELKLKSNDKQEAIASIEGKIKQIQTRNELTKTAKRKLKRLIKLKNIAEGRTVEQRQQQKTPNSKSEATKRRERKKNGKKQLALADKAVSQLSEVKTNGKANKNLKVQNKTVAKKTLQKAIEDSEDEVEGDSDEEEEELGGEEGESGDEELNSEEEVDEEEESGDQGEEESGDEEESEDESEDNSPPPPKVPSFTIAESETSSEESFYEELYENKYYEQSDENSNDGNDYSGVPLNVKVVKKSYIEEGNELAGAGLLEPKINDDALEEDVGEELLDEDDWIGEDRDFGLEEFSDDTDDMVGGEYVLEEESSDEGLDNKILLQSEEPEINDDALEEDIGEELLDEEDWIDEITDSGLEESSDEVVEEEYVLEEESSDENLDNNILSHLEIKKKNPANKKLQKVGTENDTTVDLNQLKKNDLVLKNQKRFVLFVGNIPYDANKQDLIEHFQKSGEIKHIRIPTEKKSSKPRGFAYLELANEESYQKCMSMNHTFLKGRRINVLYTQGGKKKGEDKKKEIKAKNFKLHAMRNQGKLAGSKKQTQKRSFRRAKQKASKGASED